MEAKIFYLCFVVSISGVFGTISEEKCKEYGQLFKDSIKVSQLASKPSTLGKESTAPGEFPHMAALGFPTEKGKIDWLCGGSLISDQYILTSAVCRQGPNGPVKKVRLGDHNIRSKSDDSTAEEYDIEKIIVHPNFKPPSVYNDIALLKLARKVKFTESIHPACVHAVKELPLDTQVSATGWGKINFGEESYPELTKVYLDLFSSKECKDTYATVSKRKLKDGILEDKMICAGGRTSSKDVCKGDSGGPLQICNKEKNVYEIVGITSFGSVCGKVGFPSVYTRVAGYIPWIESVVWS